MYTIYLRRFLRYIFMFLLVFISSVLVCGAKLTTMDIIMLSMLITICFLFLDLYYPIVLY